MTNDNRKVLTMDHDMRHVANSVPGFGMQEYQDLVDNPPAPAIANRARKFISNLWGNFPIGFENVTLYGGSIEVSFRQHSDNHIDRAHVYGTEDFGPVEIYREGTVWGNVARRIAEKNGVFFNRSTWFLPQLS